MGGFVPLNGYGFPDGRLGVTMPRPPGLDSELDLNLNALITVTQ